MYANRIAVGIIKNVSTATSKKVVGIVPPVTIVEIAQ